jgi:hypothetical protein
MAVRGFPDVEVIKYDQPRQQGVPSLATIFFLHIFTKNVGWVARKDVWNATNQAMDHVETQRRESRFQIGALAPQTPSDPTLPTAADFAWMAATTMQSSATLAMFLSNNCGVQHITDLSVTYFEDDKGQNEANPSFDVVISHQDVFTVPGITITEFEARITYV